MLEKREFDKNDFMWRVSTAVAVTSGIFTFIIFVLLAVNYLQIRKADPINNELVKQIGFTNLEIIIRQSNSASRSRSKISDGLKGRFWRARPSARVL